MNNKFPFTSDNLDKCIGDKSEKNSKGLSIKQLQDIAKSLGLPISGNKKTLCLRIISYYEKEPQEIETVAETILDPITKTLIEVCKVSPEDIIEEISSKVGTCINYPEKMCKQYHRELQHYKNKVKFDKTKTDVGQKLGEGSYGSVYILKDQPEIASKKMSDDDNNISFVLEVSALQVLSGLPSIINILDLTHSNYQYDKINVNPTSYINNLNIYIPAWPKTLKVGTKYNNEQLRNIFFQLLQAISFMHNRNIIHRDIKPENILWDPEVNEIAVADFGLSTYSVYNKDKLLPVQTLMYRSPEVLLNVTDYDYKIDLWSIGIMILELFIQEELIKFYDPDSDLYIEIKQLEIIWKLFGIPNDSTWPGISKIIERNREFGRKNPIKNLYNALQNSKLEVKPINEVFSINDNKLADLLSKLLIQNPKQRIGVFEALRHPYFSDYGYKLYEMELSPIDRVKTTDIFCIDSDYIKKSDMKGQIRIILFDWLIDVIFKFKLNLDTLLLAFQLIDLFLMNQEIKRADYQLLGVSALYIASIVHDTDPIEARDLSYVTDDAFSKIQVMKMSDIILDTLNYNIFIPSEITYLQAIFEEFDLKSIKNWAEVYNSATYFILLASLSINTREFDLETVAKTALALGQIVANKQLIQIDKLNPSNQMVKNLRPIQKIIENDNDKGRSFKRNPKIPRIHKVYNKLKESGFIEFTSPSTE